MRGAISMDTEQRTRLDWLDVAKGLGIVLVVLGHTERGLVASGIAPESWRSGLDFYLYTFHMPLFMFLAGLNVPQSLRAGARRFILRKLATIVWPYVLWSMILGTVGILLSSHTNNPGDWSDLWRIGWRPISPFWFLYVIFIYSALVAVTGVRMVVLGPLSILAFGLGLIFKNDSLVQQLLHFLIFFVAGALSATRLQTIQATANESGPWWVAVAMAAWFGISWAVAAPSDYRYFSAWGLPSALLGTVFVIALALNVSGPARTMLAALGRASMPIYVMHILATAGTRIVLTRLDLTDSPIVYVVVGTMAGVLAPYAAYRVVRRLRWLPALGFGRNTGSSATAESASGARH